MNTHLFPSPSFVSLLPAVVRMQGSTSFFGNLLGFQGSCLQQIPLPALPVAGQISLAHRLSSVSLSWSPEGQSFVLTREDGSRVSHRLK